MVSSPTALPVAGPSGRLGVLVCGHGSRNRLAVAEFAELAEQLRQALAPVPVAHGYLEFARPILRDGLESLRAQGVEHVLAVPAMLFAAGHAKNDIPSVLRTYSAETGLRIDYGRELGIDRNMIGAAAARIREALDQASPVPLHDTLLVVVGRGSSDPDANSNVAKVTRMLVEGFGFGWGETVYSGVTFPLVEPGLRHAIRLGFRRIVVAPYFLFSGVLVSRILAHTEKVAQDHPDIEFLTTSYLGDHPLVLETFRDRVLDVLRGDTDMNCSLCKYRAQVLGFEAEVGAPQHSHHHHVEGLTEGCTLCERECTGACQEAITAPVHTHADGHVHSHGTSGPSDVELSAARALSHGREHSQGHEHSLGHEHSHAHDHPHSHDHVHAHEHTHEHTHEHGQPQAHESSAQDSTRASSPSPGPSTGEAAHGAELSHVHSHGQETGAHPTASADGAHGHHHPIYPHADHPLGPRTLRDG